MVCDLTSAKLQTMNACRAMRSTSSDSVDQPYSIRTIIGMVSSNTIDVIIIHCPFTILQLHSLPSLLGIMREHK